MYRKDQLDRLMNHFQEYMNFASAELEKLLLAFEKRDSELATEIMDVLEPLANKFESEIEEEAITFLALNNAEASILRTLVMVIKMNNDIERICDSISNIAESIDKSIKDGYRNDLLRNQLVLMITKSVIMLKDVNYAFLQRDVALCEAIIRNDDEIDNLHQDLYRMALSEILKNPEDTKKILRFNRMSKNMERACDLMTNIAEDIIFLVSGKDVKHTH